MHRSLSAGHAISISLMTRGRLYIKHCLTSTCQSFFLPLVRGKSDCLHGGITNAFAVPRQCNVPHTDFDISIARRKENVCSSLELHIKAC